MADKEVEQHFSIDFGKPTITLTNEKKQDSSTIKEIIIQFITQCHTIPHSKKMEIIQGILTKNKISHNMAMFILKHINLDTKFDKKLKDKIRNHILRDSIDKTIENSVKENLQSYKVEITTIYDKITDIFASLLPKVSSAGIATVFANEMRTRQFVGGIHLSICYLAIILILVIADDFYTRYNQFTIIDFLKLLSFEAPLAFLATFSAKKSHQNKRIYEEYAHKYTVAIAYIGLCKEIQENEQVYGKDAVKNLSEGFRNALFRNPSTAIDKKIDDIGTPFELVERLIQSVGQPAAEALIKSRGNQDA